MDNDTSWNYDELAEKLTMGRIDVDEAAVPLPRAARNAFTRPTSPPLCAPLPNA